MQIHELPLLGTAPTSSDFIPVDDGTKTYKAPADGLGITTQMSKAEAVAGTVTSPRVITPAVFNAAIKSIFPSMTEAEAEAGTSTDPMAIAPAALNAAIETLVAAAIDAYAETQTYKAGDVLAIPANGAAQYPGKWASTSALRFLIPMSKPVSATSVTVAGAIIASANGKTVSATIGSNVTAAASIVPSGVAVILTFSSAQANATANHAAAVQSNPLTITFS